MVNLFTRLKLLISFDTDISLYLQKYIQKYIVNFPPTPNP